MITTIKALGPELGVVATCLALSIARATYYRQIQPRIHGPAPKKLTPRELAIDEQKAVLAVLHEDRFVDLAPAEVYATLLDEGRYLCSERMSSRIRGQDFGNAVLPSRQTD